MDGNYKILELLDILDNLKHLKRTGWLRYNIPESETVASHMYRMAVLAMSLQSNLFQSTENYIDIVRCIKMALVHDIGEAIVGDITPHCGYSKEQKFQLESDALEKITSLVPLQIKTEWLSLWHEYELGNTKEAVVVKELDKLDMIAQAKKYEEKYNLDLSEFFNYSFKNQIFIDWAQKIKNSRLSVKNN